MHTSSITAPHRPARLAAPRARPTAARRLALTAALGSAQSERAAAEKALAPRGGGGGGEGWLNAEGEPLTADEIKSLRRALGAPAGATGDLLRAGLAKAAKDLPELEGAMLAAEQARAAAPRRALLVAGGHAGRWHRWG
jgi:hypothetical protein